MVILRKAYRLIELLVCGPTAHELRWVAVEMSLPTLDEIDYEVLGSSKCWNTDEI